jgi:hypothetical protein
MSLLQNCPTQAASEKSWPLRPGSLGRPGVFARLPRNESFTLNTGLGQGDGRPRTGHHLIRTVLRTVVFLGDGGGVRQAILQPVVGPTMWPACWPPVWTGLPSQRPCSRHRSMASLRLIGNRVPESAIAAALRAQAALPDCWRPVVLLLGTQHFSTRGHSVRRRTSHVAAPLTSRP